MIRKNNHADCKVCGGSRWVRVDLPFGHPDYGKLFPCPELDPASLLKIYDYVGLRIEEIEDLKWSRFKKIGNVEEAIEAVREVLERGYGWVFLYGEYGPGKTTILKTAVAEWYRDRGPSSAYTEMAKIIDDIRSVYDLERPNEEKIKRISRWSSFDLLAIDEIDKVKPTEFAEEVSFTLLNARYEKTLYKDGITIIASNKSPDKLPPYLASRIRDNRFRVVGLDKVPDVRQAMIWD